MVIPKGMKEPQSEMTYRPICLLDTIGKLYEMLIREKLTKELEEKKYLAERQYGFRKGRSTVQAVLAVTEDPKVTKSKWCVLILLDVKNAFNTASWDLIMCRLKEANISEYLTNLIGNYLCKREILFGKKGVMEIKGGRGCHKAQCWAPPCGMCYITRC